MPLHARRLVTIVTEAVIERELTQALEGLGVSGYTVTDARGKGHRGTRDAVWEHGASIRVEIVCDERVATAIVDHLAERYYENYAMILFVSDVAVLRPEKF